MRLGRRDEGGTQEYIKRKLILQQRGTEIELFDDNYFSWVGGNSGVIQMKRNN